MIVASEEASVGVQPPYDRRPSEIRVDREAISSLKLMKTCLFGSSYQKGITAVNGEVVDVSEQFVN